MDFNRFMEDRANQINSGRIHHNARIAATVNHREKAQCSLVASDQAKADRSDPFTYNRVMSHMMNGVVRRSDYEHQWGKERGYSAFKPHSPISCEIATHRKIPCL